MNLNHDPDKHLLDQIDKVLENGQPSGDTVVDELATTRPAIRPTFQTALEERLLARLEQIKQGETPMVNSSSYMTIPTPRRNWLPLTLLVALIVVAIAGVILINGRGKTPRVNEMALAPATETATVAPTPTGSIVPPVMAQSLRLPGVGGVAPVVIAARDIPQGTVLSSRWLETVYWADDTGNTQTYTDVEVLHGLVAKQDIPRWQPILPSYLTDQPVSTIHPTDVPSPNVNVVVAFQNLPRGYTFSDRDLSNAAGYAGWPANEVPNGAIRDNEKSNFTMLEGKTLQEDVPRGQPILTSMLQADVQPTRSNVGIHPPIDRVTIAVPLVSLTTDSLVPGVGGSVDIVALLPFKSPDQNVNIIPATAMPDGSQLVETILIRDTLVLFHDQWPQINAADAPATITFAVSPQDSRMLAWLAEQPQVTFRLQKPLNNVFELPADARIIAIPFDNVTADEDIQPGDKVDVYSTCALVPDVMGMNNTVVSSKTDCDQTADDLRATKAAVFTGKIVVSGQQSAMTYQSIALTVPPDKVPLFTQLLGAKMHFKLVKSPSTDAIQPTPMPSVPPNPTPQAGDKQTLTVPLSAIASVQGTDIHTADHVTVSVTYIRGDISKAPPELQQLLLTPQPGLSGDIEQYIAINALVVDLSSRNLTLEVSPEEAAKINLALTYNHKLNLIQVTTNDISFTLTPTLLPVPSGKVTIDIPTSGLNLITLSNLQTAEGSGYQVGNYVSIIATFLTVDTNDKTPTAIQDVRTLQPSETPNQLRRAVVPAALITAKTQDVLTVAVSPDEAATIQSLLDAKLPLNLRPVPPLLSSDPPSNALTLTLDSVSRWSADSLEVGDKVDLVMGLVQGGGSNLNLSFRPHLEYNWIDPLTNSTQTIRTYIPANTTTSAGAFFLRRFIQNAIVYSIEQQTDPKSGRIQSIKLTLDLSSNTASPAAGIVQTYINAGLPYLILKDD